MKKNEQQNAEQQNKPENISIKEVERIGLGLRSMQTQADILKRKKCRKRKIIITVMILTVIIAGIVVYQIKKTEEEATTVESSEDVVAGENQDVILGEITEINGNEMTFTLVEEEESTETESEGTKAGNRPSGGAPTGEQKTGEVQSVDGEASTEGGTESKPTMPTAMPETKTYRSLGEERTATIPVGTDVITKLGTTTTFARLATGDVVQMLTEKVDDENVIIKMWIVG